MKRWGYTLSSILDQVDTTTQIRRNALHFNDLLIVTTRNSIYRIIVLGPNDFFVYGGWFERKGLIPYRTSINGCTWGGSMLMRDVIAAHEMCIEFGNRVTTTFIKTIEFHPGAGEN